MSQWATQQWRDNKRLKLSFIDVRKAYFHGVPTRKIFVRLPPELGLGKDLVGRLDRCMYGTRDAGAIWEGCYSDALIQMGFRQGVASPCCFFHPDWQVQVDKREKAIGPHLGERKPRDVHLDIDKPKQEFRNEFGTPTPAP